MRNAAAPITGGMICPPLDATASMAAAMWAGKPVRFISGMVIAPSTTTLATALPETVPNSADETTETLAGPPRYRPVAIKRKIGEKFIAADRVKRLAKQDERDHDAGSDVDGQTQHGVGVEIEIARDARPRGALRVENSRQKLGEFRVQNDAEGEPSERAAGNAARSFDNQDERESAEDPTIRREHAEPVSDGRI